MDVLWRQTTKIYIYQYDINTKWTTIYNSTRNFKISVEDAIRRGSAMEHYGGPSVFAGGPS